MSRSKDTIRRPRYISRGQYGQKIAAELILADVEKHGGEDSATVHWARLFMERYRLERAEQQMRAAGLRPLFGAVLR